MKKVNAIIKPFKEEEVKESQVYQVVETIAKSAYTGKIGDSKIFVSDIEKVIRIRTSEINDEAI